MYINIQRRQKSVEKQKKGEKTMDDLVKKIKRARKVIAALTQLVLEIGTLLSVVKMIVESLS